MARVSITINSKSYEVACGDGEEQKIRDLAATVDAKVSELVNALGQAGEGRLLAMAGLLLADELAEANKQVLLNQQMPPPAPMALNVDEEKLAQSLESFAQDIENIAERVEGA